MIYDKTKPCIEKLPPSKTDPHRSITWRHSGTVPNAGLLKISTKKGAVEYLVVEMVGAPPARLFLLAKTTDSPDLGDPDEHSYCVAYTHATGEGACQCKGAFYGKGARTCKHIEAVKAILDNGWMDASQWSNPEADVGNTEPPF